MKKITHLMTTAGACAILLSSNHAHAATMTWKNDGTGTDFNIATNWNGGLPTGNNVAGFSGTVVSQPAVSAAASTAGLNFASDAAGYDITGQTLTLTGYGTSATGGTNSAASAIYSASTSGTNTIDTAIVLSPAGVTNLPRFNQAGAGGSLVINGVVSGSVTLQLNVTGGSSISLTNLNIYNGGTSLFSASATTNVATVALGNDSALGAGTILVNSTNINLTALNSARTLSNAVTWGGNSVVGGSNNFTFDGIFTSSGSSSRTLTVNNTATTTLAGNVFLSETTATGRSLAINGSGATTISGVIANASGGLGAAGTLSYNGTNTLTLSAANTYTGSTNVSGGTVSVGGSAGAKLGTGNVNVLSTAVTLSIATGVTDAIADTATLSLAGGGTSAVADAGYLTLGSGVNETVQSLLLSGIGQAAGTYGALGTGATFMNDEYFSGTGVLTVLTTVPEPSTLAAVALGGAFLMARRRRVRMA